MNKMETDWLEENEENEVRKGKYCVTNGRCSSLEKRVFGA